METDNTRTNLEEDKTNLKDSALPILMGQNLPKRIRKRIKSYRKVVAGMPVNFAIPKPDKNPY